MSTIKPFDANNFEKWKREIDRIMVRNFAINTADAGLDKNELQGYRKQQLSADVFVSWFGEKYDLTPISDWNWQSFKSKI
jgi:hypothetical protein